MENLKNEISKMLIDSIESKIIGYENKNITIKGWVFLGSNRIFAYENEIILPQFSFNNILRLQSLYNIVIDSEYRWNIIEFNYIGGQPTDFMLNWDQEYFDIRSREVEKYIKRRSR